MSNETVKELTIRLATTADLEFVQHDRRLPRDVVCRKIGLQEVFVAERDRQLVGQAWLEYLWSAVPYLALIHVIPDHRRQGVGMAMLQHLEGHLWERGYDLLYSSSQANEPEPQAWHRHVGFVECGFIAGINRGGVGEIFFRKQLP